MGQPAQVACSVSASSLSAQALDATCLPSLVRTTLGWCWLFLVCCFQWVFGCEAYALNWALGCLGSMAVWICLVGGDVNGFEREL